MVTQDGTRTFVPLPWQRRFIDDESPAKMVSMDRGAGKSAALAMAAVKDTDKPHHTAALVVPEDMGRGLRDACNLWYPNSGGKYDERTLSWRFQSGARVLLVNDAFVNSGALDGLDLTFLGFDLIDGVKKSAAKRARDRLKERFALKPKLRAVRDPHMDWIREMFPTDPTSPSPLVQLAARVVEVFGKTPMADIAAAAVKRGGPNRSNHVRDLALAVGELGSLLQELERLPAGRSPGLGDICMCELLPPSQRPCGLCRARGGRPSPPPPKPERVCSGFGLGGAPDDRCCERAGEYNGFSSGPTLFTCPKSCACHD